MTIRRRIKVRTQKRRQPPEVVFPYIGSLEAPVWMILDPVVGNLGAKSPLTTSQLKWFAGHAQEAGKFRRDDVCIISCATPVDGDTWGQGKLINGHLKEQRPEFLKIMEFYKPKFVMPFGAKACQQLIGRAVQITKVRGQPFMEPSIANGVPVLPMFSPFYAQRQPEHEAAFIADMHTASRIYLSDYDIEASAIDYKHKYEWCYDLEWLIKKKPKRLSVDVEGVGLIPFDPKTKLLTVQICYEKGKTVVVPINYDRGKLRHHDFIPWDQIDRKKLIRQVKRLMEDPRIEKVGQNFKFDWLYLYYKLGIKTKNYAHDTMLLAHLHDENQRRINLDDLVRQHVPEMAGFNDGHNTNPIHQGKSRMDLLPPEDMLAYSAGDADAAWRLLDVLLDKVGKDPGVMGCYNHVTMPAQRAFCDIELNGFPVSEKELSAFEVKLRKHQKIERGYLLRQIPKTIKDKWRDSGVGLKVTRAAILRDWLYEHEDGLQLEPKSYTKTKLPSISSKQALPYYVADNPEIARLIDYIKNDKLLNTYAKGFYKYIYDELIRPSYGLAGTVTGRSMCFVAGTQVTVLDKRGSVSIQNIKPGDWVWGFDKAGKPTPTEVTAAFETKTVTRLAKVVYRTQGRRRTKLLRCTPDHRFRLRDGSYVEAQNLEPGHRLMSLEREVDARGYRRCYATGNETFIEHRAVAEKFAAIDCKHVHHKDTVKLNNRPDNLEPLDPAEHIARHPWMAERRERLGATILRSGKKAPVMKGEANPRWYDIEPEEIIDRLENYNFSLAKYCRAHNRDYTCVAAKFVKDGYDPADAGKEAKRRYQQKVLPKARQCIRVVDAARILKTNFYEARELLASDNNHEVIRVEVYDCESTPVYDITTPETSCFVANGVCVHNSRDPNGQNFPKRGKLAKDYRRIFKAPKGWVFLACDLSQAELRIAAMMSGDPNMLAVYASGGDIHRTTAAAVMGLTLEEFAQLPADVQGLKRFQAKACIAKGQMVLTNRGLVPIEDVTIDCKLWDGKEWVAHGGVIYKGRRKVIHYANLEATAEHPVFLKDGRMLPFGQVASELRGQELSVTGVATTGHGHAHHNIVGNDYQRLFDRHGGLLGMRRALEHSLQQSAGRQNPYLPMPAGPEVQLPHRARNSEALRCDEATVPESYERMVSSLRRAGDSATNVETAASRAHSVDCDSERNTERRNRPHGQQRSLRSREFACNSTDTEFAKQTGIGSCGLQGHSSECSRSMASAENGLSELSLEQRPDCAAGEADNLAGYSVTEAEVYDIRDAGPRNRFTVSGRLVHNCNFGFLYGMWWVKFRSYAKTEYGIDFTEDEAKEIRENFFRTYPMLHRWHNEAQSLVAQEGYIRTFDGRVRHLPNVFSKDEGIAKQAMRQAINSPVQSIASDLGLMSLGRIIPYIQEKGYDEWFKVCGFIHDAIVVLVREDKVAQGAAMLKYFMESNPTEEWFGWTPEIPITADAEIGRTLADTYELKPSQFDGTNRHKTYCDLVRDEYNVVASKLAKETDADKRAGLEKTLQSIADDLAISGETPSTPQRKRRIIKPKRSNTNAQTILTRRPKVRPARIRRKAA